MRAMLALLPLLAIGAAPAPVAAQTNELPLWLVGDWCPAYVLEQPPITDPRLAPTLGRDGYGPLPHCMKWSASGGSALNGSTSRGYSGRNDSFDRMTIAPGKRGLVYGLSTAYDGKSPFAPVAALNEVSRGPFEIAFQNRGRREPWRVSFRRDGAVLTRTIVWEKGDAPYTFPYYLRAPD